MSEKRRSIIVVGVWLSAVCLLISVFLQPETRAFNEAPMITPLVKANELPPVDERLPKSPPVVYPIEKSGAYGGTWRRAYIGLSDLVGGRRILYDPLVRWSQDFEIVPNLAEKWEIDETGRIFTFYLVKGVRWSDGAPFTADDIIFYFEDILSNRDLTPSLPRWVSPDGIPPKVTKIDDYAIRIEFAKPYSLFLQRLACPEGMELVTKPKHYLKKFHKRYAEPEELQALMKEKKASSWLKLFEDAAGLRHALFVNTDLPSVCAWITKVPAPATRLVMQRNPFYWKVDPNGNQLPYIDSIVHELLAEPQTILLKAIAGEIDMQGRLLGGMQNSILLVADKSKGKYKLVPKMSTASVGLLLAPNLNHKNPEMRKILSDHRFRKALSHAINRNEINKIVYRGQGVPRQAAPLKESPFYSESYEKAYLEYAPEKARALLDEMGVKVGSRGKRIGPDGKPIRLVLDVTVVQDWIDAAEIIATSLDKIGIDTEVKTETRALFRLRVQSAAHDIALWPGDGGMECLLEPRWYFPYSTESLNAPLYGLWYQTRGKQGEEPPAELRELMEVYDTILTTTSQDKMKELFEKIITANEKNLWVIGLVSEPPDYYVATINFHNLPKKDFQSWIYPNPGPVHPEQFFMMPK
ncbi:MAG TPA: ABC transporter substrate-binding protein [Desulfomonilaceae bacterium]|nr:ABC transporter substrate-binding protein [Desulfomonilaceae bacterium]